MTGAIVLDGATLTPDAVRSVAREGTRVELAPEARARNEDEANGYGPPRRAKRGYHGKRDLTPRDE